MSEASSTQQIPAIGEVPKLCWSSGTICSTLVKCGTEFKSCLAAGYRYDIGGASSDAPTSFGPFAPENFDGRFFGPVTAQDALIRSRNVPAVWVASQLRQPGRI